MLSIFKSLLVCFLLVVCLFVVTRNTYAAANTEILTRPWLLTAARNATERYQLVDQNILKGTTQLRLTYDLKGTCLLDGDASAIIFDQPINRAWRFISLSRYGKNCLNAEQTVNIPLTHFKQLDLSKPVGTFHVRIWHNRPYNIIIKSAILIDSSIYPPPSSNLTFSTPTFNSTPTKIPVPTLFPTIFPTFLPPAYTPFPTLTVMPTPTDIPNPTNIPTPTVFVPTFKPIPTIPLISTTSSRPSWSIQSVSSMKETKDRICNPRPQEFIQKWVDKAVDLGVNYISIETPYENPRCGDANAYTKAWIDAARAKGLKVWHRHMPLAFEGIYDTPKNATSDYLNLISEYIRASPSFFAEGDIFTPIPEPQNGGIYGVTYCPHSICIFKNASDFNIWLRNAMDSSETAFASIGLGGKMKIGYYGFDGFIAWGDNNPDWDGILEDQTVIKMGNITIDHYPEIVGDTMNNDLTELEARYPNIPIIIGEWGTITGSNPELQAKTSMQAARRPSVVGFNYWHMGVGGNEELLREDFTLKNQYDEVQSFYKGTY